MVGVPLLITTVLCVASKVRLLLVDVIGAATEPLTVKVLLG